MYRLAARGLRLAVLIFPKPCFSTQFPIPVLRIASAATDHPGMTSKR